jgi:hypothetical protein
MVGSPTAIAPEKDFGSGPKFNSLRYLCDLCVGELSGFPADQPQKLPFLS